MAVVWGYDCSPKPENQPQPPSASCICCQPLDARLDHPRDFVVVEHRIALEPLPAGGASPIVADFLGVEIGALFLDLLQVEAHVDQDLLGDDGRQEAVERLLGAAVGIVGQVGQGIDHRAGQRRAIAHFEHRIALPPLGGHVERDLAFGVFAAAARRRTNPS